CASESLAKSSPSTTTRPLSGRVSPPRRYNRVDFPLPEGPTTARNSPRSTTNDTPRTAGTSTLPTWYTLRTSSTWIIGSTQNFDITPAGFGEIGPGCGSLNERGTSAMNERDV